jgi:hypothetical protein
VFGMKIAALTLAVSLAISAFWYVGSLRDRVGEQEQQIESLDASLTTAHERVANRETARLVIELERKEDSKNNAAIIRKIIADGDRCADAPVPIELRQ